MKKQILSQGLFFVLLMLPILCFSQWSTNPAVNNVISNLSGEQVIPKIATCSNGDTYIGFFSSETGNYDVRLQRLDALGNILWAPNGILISGNPQETWLTDWDMTCDASNHAILVFNDIRTGSTNVVAYRISPSGGFVWGANGIMLSNSTAFNVAPKVVSTAAGNIVVAWQADDVIIRQKISPSGALQWGPAGITLTSPNSLSWPQLMPVGADDVIMKYFDDSGPPNAPTRHVYAQRYSSTGTDVWTSNAIISNAGGISAWTQIFPFINDGSDGFYIAWHDDRDNNQRASVFVQHISSAGAVLYSSNGVEASNLSSMNHYYPQLALPPGSTDVFVYWNEMNALQSQWGIFGQKINSSGAVQWGGGGMTFIPVSLTDVYPYEARNTPTDMILVFEQYSNAIDGMIKAMRISPSGAMLWTPAQKEICTVSSQKVHPVVNEFANNQWIVAWEDDRGADVDVYAQNIQLDGSLGPAFSGTISGTITLNGGSGNVAQVVVSAGTTTTSPDATGFYSMTVLSGAYAVSASLSGYQGASQSNVVVTTNQTTTVNLTLIPVPTGYIHGTVTLSSGFGIIQQVLVSAGTHTTNPDQNGNYTLTVSPGTYNVIASLTAYIPDTVMNVSVANQQTVTGINLTLVLAPTNGLMTGTVTLNGGTGNVTQVVVTAGGGVATTNPNASGFYTLDLPAGNYDVTASLAGYATQMLTGIPVVVNQTTPNVNFTLVPVAGTGNIKGLVTIVGEPADVTLTDVTAGSYSTHPNAFGNYDLVVPAGTYNVVATHPYTTTVTVSNVLVAQGQATTGINFLLTVNRADMVCRAVDNLGTTLNNVGIEIQGPEGPYNGTIINDSLTFLHVPYGTFNGTAYFPGSYPVLSDTVINANNHHLLFVFILDGIAEKNHKTKLSVVPNPAGFDSRVCFDLPVAGSWTLEVVDGMGCNLGTMNRIMEKGSHQIALNEIIISRNLQDGVYCIRLTGPNGESGACKMLFCVRD
ncbi:MAG: carboxypeptidase-like regulatory domain-containing protein [Bacteroidetes bacterium]|nr:carboxypeptidase-like regulatory domain-containing protein [Bacteroidota bacterium]